MSPTRVPSACPAPLTRNTHTRTPPPRRPLCSPRIRLGTRAQATRAPQMHDGTSLRAPRSARADGEPGERSNASPAQVAIGPGGQNRCDSVYRLRSVDRLYYLRPPSCVNGGTVQLQVRSICISILVRRGPRAPRAGRRGAGYTAYTAERLYGVRWVLCEARYAFSGRGRTSPGGRVGGPSHESVDSMSSADATADTRWCGGREVSGPE